MERNYESIQTLLNAVVYTCYCVVIQRQGARGDRDDDDDGSRDGRRERGPRQPGQTPGPPTGNPPNVDQAGSELGDHAGAADTAQLGEPEDHTASPGDEGRGGRGRGRRHHRRPEDHTGDPREREDRTGRPLDSSEDNSEGEGAETSDDNDQLGGAQGRGAQRGGPGRRSRRRN